MEVRHVSVGRVHGLWMSVIQVVSVDDMEMVCGEQLLLFEIATVAGGTCALGES